VGEGNRLSDETILFLAYSVWSVFRQDNELASLLSRNNRVMYVEKQRPSGGQWFRAPSSAMRRCRPYDLVRENEGLAICSPPPRLPWPSGLRSSPLKRLLFRLSLHLNAMGLRRVIKEALAALAWQPSILWCYEADALLLRRFFDVKWAAYRVYDETSLFPSWIGIRAEFDEIEREVIGQADLVFASSRSQFEKRRHWHPRVYHLPNAGDFDRHSQYAQGRPSVRPVDLPDRGPILMFIGTLDYRLDCDLLAGLATQRPQWQLVLVGPVRRYLLAKPELQRLGALPNVFMLGEKPIDLTPDYLYHADVSLIPYHLTESTRTMFPWKVYEHLAAGKPIVATALPELEDFKDLLYWARDKDEFASFVDAAICEAPDDSRIAARVHLASQNSWDSRVQQIADIVAQCETRVP